MSSRALSKKHLSLGAVCFQSTVLALVLHVCQTQTQRFRGSSAVLLAELLKLLLSLLLALREIHLELGELRRPVHALPSPSLYAKAGELQRKSLYYSDDPLERAPGGMRRRSSARGSLSLDIINERTHASQVSLGAFAWPVSPVLEEFLIHGGAVAVKDDRGRVQLRPPKLFSTLAADVFSPGDVVRMAIPAALFAAQNNLIYVAARNVSTPVFQVTFQLKTLVTALAAVLMLGRKLGPMQCVSLGILGVGVASMQLGSIVAKAHDSHQHPPLSVSTPDEDYLTGITAILVSCVCSAVAATYFERIIKQRALDGDPSDYTGPRTTKPPSLWVRNVQLSAWSMLFGIVVVYAQANLEQLEQLAFWSSGLSTELDGLVADPLLRWYDPVVRSASGFFSGLTPVVWAVVLLQSIGGLLIALAIKHADNVAKGFALSVSVVFTFLLSVILFDFPLTTASILGGTAVIGSTLLFEVDEARLARLLMRHGSYTDDKGALPPLLKRWHTYALVVLGVTSLVALVPGLGNHYSVTSTAWGMVTANLEILQDPPPSVAIASSMGSINDLLATSARDDCLWSVRPHRQSTLAPYGLAVEEQRSSPYYIRETGEFALDDILFARFTDYARSSPLFSIPAPDFIFLPVLSYFYSNPGGECDAPRLHEGIRQTTSYIRQLAKSIGDTPYPRIILPLAGIRASLQHQLFTPEIMAELKDRVIVVGVEGASKSYVEGMKYVLDVPYPTRQHLSETSGKKGKREEKVAVGDHFLNKERPFLVHYAASLNASGGPPSDPFNGVALHRELHKQLTGHVAARPSSTASLVLYDIVDEPSATQQNSTLPAENMARSVFCLQPPGDSPTRREFYEAIQFGCIPVIFRESYSRLFASSPEFDDLSLFTVFIEENDMLRSGGESLISRLESIPLDKIRRKQLYLREINRKIQWSLPTGDDGLLDEWFPVQAHSQRDSPLGQVVRWNREESIARKAGRVILPDAFTMLLKELSAIKAGTWKGRPTQDLRLRGSVVKQFGSSRSEREVEALLEHT